MPEHSLLIFAETASASYLNSWGSRKASGENRLRITYVAIRYLLADISAVVFAITSGSIPALAARTFQRIRAMVTDRRSREQGPQDCQSFGKIRRHVKRGEVRSLRED